MDDENRFKLDEEDVAFLEKDVEGLEVGAEVKIEDTYSNNSQTANDSQVPIPTSPDSYKPVTFHWKETSKNFIPPKNVDPQYDYGRVLHPYC